MSIINGYTDYATVKAELKLGNDNDQTRLERIITMVSREIDKFCGFPGRQFYQSSAGIDRYFTPEEPTQLWIDDITTLTALTIDFSGEGTFELTYTKDTDFVLYPYNAAELGRPYTKIEMRSSVGKIFSFARKSCKITGTWGWPAIPAEVSEAAINWTIHAAGLRNAPFGIAEVPAIDGGGIRIGPMPPGVKDQLYPFVRDPLSVG